MDQNYKIKKEKYNKKITEKLASNITFNVETHNKIVKVIKQFNFIKNILKKKHIMRTCTINNDLQIIINIGESVMKYTPYRNGIITFNDIVEMVTTDELLDSLKVGDNELDLLANEYENIIKDAVVLGYIFLLNYEKKIKFYSIKNLNPVTKKIVEMVYKENDLAIPAIKTKNDFPDFDNVQC